MIDQAHTPLLHSYVLFVLISAALQPCQQTIKLDAENLAPLYNSRCSQKQPAEGCNFVGWATTLYRGSILSDFAYLPIPKSGSMMLRELLAPKLGFEFCNTPSISPSIRNLSRRVYPRGNPLDFKCMPDGEFQIELQLSSHFQKAMMYGPVVSGLHPNTTCTFFEDCVRGKYQIPDRVRWNGWHGKIFTFITDPLKHLFHGFGMFDPNLNATKFVRAVSNSYKSCFVHGKQPVQRNVHIAPQAWHIMNTLGHSKIDYVWLLDSDTNVGRTLSDVFKIDVKLTQRAMRMAKRSHFEDLEGERGWTYLSDNFAEADVRLLCNVLKADYWCFGLPMPEPCRRLKAIT